MNMEKIINTAEQKERSEQVIKLPIIDIVRHGKSKYKEYFDKEFKFDQSADDFSLSPDSLDITKEGIEELEETARQIENLINKENEILLLVTSPSARAQSSLLVVRKYLEQQGITFLNPNKTYKTKQLRPLDLKNVEKDKDEFIQKTQEYVKEVGSLSAPTDEVKEEIAQRMNREFGDLFAENSFEAVNNRLKRFLRHMINIHKSLFDDTKKTIGDKQLRILCLSHEELPVKFIKEVFGEDSKINMQNGQILEIKPNESEADKNVMNGNVTLYPKGKETGTINKDVEIKL